MDRSDHTVEEIAESFINGNISWVRLQLAGRPKKLAAVADWLREHAPNELETFLRIMSR